MEYMTLLEATLPDILVVVALFAALGVDYGLGRGNTPDERGRVAAGVVTFGLLLAFGCAVYQLMQGGAAPIGEGQLLRDPAGLAAKAIIYGFALFVVQFAAHHAPTTHASEYCLLHCLYCSTMLAMRLA